MGPPVGEPKCGQDPRPTSNPSGSSTFAGFRLIPTIAVVQSIWGRESNGRLEEGPLGPWPYANNGYERRNGDRDHR